MKPTKITFNKDFFRYDHLFIGLSVPIQMWSQHTFTRKRRRIILEELNAYYNKGKLSKKLWQTYRLQVRLGTFAQAQEIEAVIKILKHAYPRQNRKRKS